MIYNMNFGDPSSSKVFWGDPIHKNVVSINDLIAHKSEIDLHIDLKYKSMNGKGSRIEDFIGASDLANIMSKRVFDRIAESGYTGLESYPVSLLSEGNWLDTHVLVQANNLCNLDEFGKVIPHSMNHCFSKPHGINTIVCSERAKNFIEEISPNVTGIRFREYKKFIFKSHTNTV